MFLAIQSKYYLKRNTEIGIFIHLYSMFLPGYLTTTVTSMLMEMSSFYLPEATFQLIAVVAKDTRRAIAAVDISVVPVPPPSVSIS